MIATTHESVSAQGGVLTWKLPNAAAFAANGVESVSAAPGDDEDVHQDQAQDPSLLKLLHDLIECLPAAAEVEDLRIWLHSPKQQSVRWQLLMGGHSAKARAKTNFALDDSIADWVWQHKRPLWIAAEVETRFPDFAQLLLEWGIKYFCAVPLMLADRRIGVLGLASTSREALIAFDFKVIARGLANVAGTFHNSDLHVPPPEAHPRSPAEAIGPDKDEAARNDFEGIIGRSASMHVLFQQLKVVAPSGSTILILGETGTGKELIARAIHNLSPRHDRPFIKVNCAAIPAGLIESELFGHERGAFTGALSRRIGRFEMAHGGTLFLDEVGDIPFELQPKLLRVLQEQEFERVGGTQTMRTDVRIVAATSRDLPQMVTAREFRPDLYYRLNVFPLRVPALRKRPEDIPLLVRHFVEFHSRKASKKVTEIPAETMEVLSRYSWPGNVRELQNVIERAVLLSPGKVLLPSLDELQIALQATDSLAAGKQDDRVTLKAVEREHILQALAATNWVIGGPEGAAARLGLQRTTLIAKMQKLGITRAQA